MPKRQHHDPRTKEAMLNALIAGDYSGDIRSLGSGPRITRLAGNVVRLEFPASGNIYDLTIHKPREKLRA